jgi:hypothetical protein
LNHKYFTDLSFPSADDGTDLPEDADEMAGDGGTDKLISDTDGLAGGSRYMADAENECASSSATLVPCFSTLPSTPFFAFNWSMNMHIA